MFDTSASAMLDEVRAAEDQRDHFFRDWDNELARYHGPGYKKTAGEDGTTDPENHPFEWVSLVVPQLVFGNPRVKVSTSRVGKAPQDVAKAIQFAINRWIRESKLRKTNEKLAVDFGMKWSVALVLPEAPADAPGAYEQEDPRGWPSVQRISPRRFIWDPLATDRDELRWMGHLVIRDKDDLIAEAEEHPGRGWDIDMIRSMTENAGLDEVREDDQTQPNRDEVAYYEIWIPEYNKGEELGKRSKGENWGAWVTLGFKQGSNGTDQANYIRKPRRYWGHRAGPYVFFGAYFVPDKVAPLAPVAACQAQAKELNDHARALSKAMAVHKKGILVDATDPDLEMKVREFEDHYVVAVQGLEDIDSKVKEVEIGGATEHHILHNQILRDRLDRNSGIHEAQRGNIGGDATATEVHTASESSGIRLGFMVQKFRDGIQECLERVAWYLYHDDTVVFHLGPDADGEFMSPITGKPINDAIYQGGKADKEGGASFDSLELEIEPYSMQRTSEAVQQARMGELDNTMVNIVPLMSQIPYVKWDEYLQMRGEFANIPNLGDLVDIEMARKFGALMLQLQVDLGAPKGSTPAQPRLGKATGKDTAVMPPPNGGAPKGAFAGTTSGNQLAAMMRKGA